MGPLKFRHIVLARLDFVVGRSAGGCASEAVQNEHPGPTS
jgi:hypothetical protein